MKVYLAGPMRGYPNFNFPAFDYAAAKLRAEGHEVFSPAERDRQHHGASLEENPTGDEVLAAEKDGFSLRKALGDDTAWICSDADAVVLLPGWENSKGAIAEAALARALGIETIVLGREYVIEANQAG
jgi:uncharacterized protein DUF4406